MTNFEYDTVKLGHGSGGIMMKRIIEDLFISEYGGNQLKRSDDAALLFDKIAFSTDSFVVSPHFFPGGDIGKLAVCGTVNDVATSGAVPKAISVAMIIEDGYPTSDLKKICESIKRSADEAEVEVVTGDTKVVEKGKCDGIFINTAGIGIKNTKNVYSGNNLKPGDRVIVTGTLGDHGITIMSTRQSLAFNCDLKSDCAPLNHLIQDVICAAPNTHAFRDPTRGGIASTLNEFAESSQVDISIEEDKLPVKPQVMGACEMLGYDICQVANEGKMIIVVPENEVDAALLACMNNKYGHDACIIGEVTEMKSPSHMPRVTVKTALGTNRILDMLVGEQLPRIC